MAELREALRTQRPSLELQRAAASEIARLDAVVASTRDQSARDALLRIGEAAKSAGWKDGDLIEFVVGELAQPVQGQVPEGWAASLRHVCDQLSELDDDTVQAQLPSLRAMLAAAPLPPAQPQEPVNRRLLEALRECLFYLNDNLGSLEASLAAKRGEAAIAEDGV